MKIKNYNRGRWNRARKVLGVVNKLIFSTTNRYCAPLLAIRTEVHLIIWEEANSYINLHKSKTQIKEWNRNRMGIRKNNRWY